MIACFGNSTRGLSLFVGGGIAWLPNVLLYWLLFKYFGTQNAQAFMKVFYFGQFLKFVLTMAGFIIVFAWTDWQPLLVLLGFMSVQSVFGLALLGWGRGGRI